MTRPTIVILAAGMGSRYGGLKQLEPVGPSGETIMDYSIYDALRAGFGRAVFVIRPEMEAAFRDAIGRRYEEHIAISYAFQRLEDLPGGFAPPPKRSKPWGTGQALLAARDAIDAPFAVTNADDFYGAESFAVLGKFLSTVANTDDSACAMVGFTLRDTLSEAGSVNRGCCRCDAHGDLEAIEEIVGLERDGRDACYTDADGVKHTLSGDTLVSMNMWGCGPRVVSDVQKRFEAFLSDSGQSLTDEFYLPAAVQELMHAQRTRVTVLRTPDRWCGVTYPADRAHVAKVIRGLVDAGTYPEQLWS